MEHLNYCRQMTKQFLVDISQPGANKAMLAHAIDLAAASTKFILPDGGRLVDDPLLKGIDESQPLRLPYPFIALEYSRSTAAAPGLARSSRAIIFAREWDDAIVLNQVSWFDSHKCWGPVGEVGIPKTGYIDRSLAVDGRVCVKHSIPAWPVTMEDFADEVGCLMNFLNILQCSNVHVERSPPRKDLKKTKSALPFDHYHILTIDVPKSTGSNGAPTGPHRSPREHLRRGHIRRLADGRRIWVNAAIVGAGKGAGVVSKDYKLRHAA